MYPDCFKSILNEPFSATMARLMSGGRGAVAFRALCLTPPGHTMPTAVCYDIHKSTFPTNVRLRNTEAGPPSVLHLLHPARITCSTNLIQPRMNEDVNQGTALTDTNLPYTSQSPKPCNQHVGTVRKHLTGGVLCAVLDLSGILCSLLIPGAEGSRHFLH